MSESWDIFVLGGINVDYLVRGPRLPEAGQAVEGDLFLQAPGGKGANQAIAAARLGARVALAGRVGEDELARLVLDNLAEEGIDTRYVVRDPQTPTGVVLLHVDARGEKQSMERPGTNRKLETSDLPQEAIQNSQLILLQLGVSIPVVTAAARLAHAAGVRVLLDPSPPDLLTEELLRLASVIKPNDFEAQAITGVQVTGRETARRAARLLMERGAGAVAIQAGDQGNLLVWPDGESFHPRVAVNTVDTTGSGDAFAAALAVALLEGQSWEQAGAFAGAAAAMASTALGAQTALPRRADLNEFLKRIYE